MKKKNYKIITLVFFQLFLMITMPAAESILMGDANSLLDRFFGFGKVEIVSAADEENFGESVDEQRTGWMENVRQEFEEFLWTEWEDDYSTYSSFVNSNSLNDIEWACCKEAKGGVKCLDVPSVFSQDFCEDSIVDGFCNDAVDGCEVGCCVDADEGLCSPQTTRLECEDSGGNWEDEDNCLIEECSQGCCVLDEDNVPFVTETRCQKLTNERGYNAVMEYHANENELECFELMAGQNWGACILGYGQCTFTTEKVCYEETEDSESFYEGYLCSNNELKDEWGIDCSAQAKVGCSKYDNQYEIYWFDSCGNQENIYSSDREASWNNGMILSKEESCNSDNANINSENCGNCNYYFGSMCSEVSSGARIDDGDFVCKSLNCKDQFGEDRVNGESWCEYDSAIGDSRDPPGSTHWIATCINGEVEVNPCSQNRQEICVMDEFRNEAGEKVALANCIANEGQTCLELTQEDCTKNSFCVWKHWYIADHFDVDVCLPKYPAGSDLTLEDGGNQEEICSYASQNCTVTWVRKPGGRKTDKVNWGCLNHDATIKMNEFCTSLGDCGSSVNYIGDGSDNFEVRGKGHNEAEWADLWKETIGNEDPIENLFATPPSLDELEEKMDYVESVSFDTSSSSGSDSVDRVDKAISTLASVSGGAGSLLYALGSVELLELNPLVHAEVLSAQSAAGLGFAFAGAALGYFAGSWLANKYGISGRSANLMQAGGMMAGAGAGILASTSSWLGVGLSQSWNPIGWLMLGAGALTMLAGFLGGFGKKKKKTIVFTCLPWQPPSGGENCGMCGEDGFPCTDYRCSSLGTACYLINENADNSECIAREDDRQIPIISPGRVSQGYGFFNEKGFSEDPGYSVEVRTDNQKCIPADTEVLVSLNTSEHAQCKIAYERNVDFENMLSMFKEGNSYTKEHVLEFSLPSVEAIKAEYIDYTNGAEFESEEERQEYLDEYTDEQDEALMDSIRDQYANYNLYVKCKDLFGYESSKEFTLNFCVKSGPDVDAPRLRSMSPKNNSVLSYDSESVDAQIWLNEPATCRVSSSGRSYDQMTSDMRCTTGLEEYDASGGGWLCETTLSGLAANRNLFYIACKDKPWLIGTEDESQRNEDSFIYVLRKTADELTIDSVDVDPEESITTGLSEPVVDVEFKVRTAGGCQGCDVECFYQIGNRNEVVFTDTYENPHITSMRIGEGTTNVNLRCEDEAGNIATATKEIVVNIDSDAPAITRAFKYNSRLKLISNEQAICYYGLENCMFDLTDENAISSSYTKEHTLDWDSDFTYYVRCRDLWGNTNTDCAIIVKPEEL